MKKINMLYCGMADDVATPFAMPFDFDRLFVIDKFDFCFSPNGTWEGQKEEIKKILKQGGNADSYTIKIAKSDKYYPKFDFHFCEIMEESDDGKIWKLKLKQSEKIKELIYYHHTNYLDFWHKDIQNIKYLMSFGATFPIQEKVLFLMLKERCSQDCLYFLKNYPYENKKNKMMFDSFKIKNNKILFCNLHNSFDKIKKMKQCQN